MNIKNKLMVAVVMLVVSVLMMTTVSYAWFTISTAPEVKGVKTDVTANGNLEMALDAGGKVPAASTTGDGATNKTNAEKNKTWGALIQFDDASIEQLKPIALTNGQPQYPVYGADGRIQQLTDLTSSSAGENGIITYSAGGEVWAIQLNLWVRTNVEGDIKISTDSKLTSENMAVRVAYAVGAAVTGDPGSAGTFPTTGFTAIGDAKATTEERALPETTIITSATENAAYPVSILIYLDGEQATNADMTNGGADLQTAALSLKLVHSVELTPMDPLPTSP